MDYAGTETTVECLCGARASQIVTVRLVAPPHDYVIELCKPCAEAVLPPIGRKHHVLFERSFTADPADDARIFFACYKQAIAIDAAERLRSR